MLLSACVEKPIDQNVNWSAVSTQNELLHASDQGVRGSGKIEMPDILTSLNSKEHYFIEFELLSETSYLVLHSHFSGFSLRDGVEIRFYKKSEECLGQVSVSLSTPGYLAQELGCLDGVKETDRLRLRLEVHDGVPEGVHFFLWQDQVSLQGEVLSSLNIVSVQTSQVNTREEGRLFFSHGRGPFWGVEFEQVYLYQLRREAPYVR